MRATWLVILVVVCAGTGVADHAAGRAPGPGWRSGRPGRSSSAANAWSPIDRAAERVFHAADTHGDGLLTDAEVREAMPGLRRQILKLVRRGVLRGVPPTALNGQASGLKLAGQEKTSQPEFVLFARSLALRMANADSGA